MDAGDELGNTGPPRTTNAKTSYPVTQPNRTDAMFPGLNETMSYTSAMSDQLGPADRFLAFAVRTGTVKTIQSLFVP